VEDRETPVLYLELGDATSDEGSIRAAALAECPGARRVTWWENCAFERTDLPMRIRDGHSLLVVEADDGFEAPPPLPGTSEAHSFRRHPRPTQGILTNGPTLGLTLILQPRWSTASD
jgi:hypothetical protein